MGLSVVVAEAGAGVGAGLGAGGVAGLAGSSFTGALTAVAGGTEDFISTPK